jgi:L-seryl-tRNA(Ser) seleniumtransferase
MAKDQITALRDFPSVEELLQQPALAAAVVALPRIIAADIIREVIDRQKEQFVQEKGSLTRTRLIEAIATELALAVRKEISRVINATGIVVHTNLGRAPLSEAIFEAIRKTVVGYGNIEFDLDTGTRGKRGEACERYLARLAGAEAATVVNNCAAGLFLTLNTLANRRSVIISRGELVQIGGGFRIPDILKKSGAKLTEVGSTNITTLQDYEAAIDERTGMLLKVHKSNFTQAGFTEEVPLKELVTLGRKYNVPVFNDLGSGVFVNTEPIMSYHEPTVQQSVTAGATVTSFSGDKLLGGSQAGLLVGTADAVSRIKRNPLFRTVRVDKITLAIIEKLLTIYLNGTFVEDIALWRLLSVPEADLYKRGKSILAALSNPAELAVEASPAFVGGGALPEASIPSVAITFSRQFKPSRLLNWFRKQPVPIIGRIEKDRFVLDLKVVEHEDLPYLIDCIRNALDVKEDNDR